MEINKIICGDTKEELKSFPDNSVDSIVTDPPYEIGFMNKKWDSSGISYNVDLWKECLRILKPGGHLLAFGGSRTYHRIACAIEDAGFEIRDQIMWIYSSGFPKSLNIPLFIDKKNGVTKHRGTAFRTAGAGDRTDIQGKNGSNEMAYTNSKSDDAKQWKGWGTALKPAHEPIVVARKPIETTIIENVLKYGTGGINIDECRIEIPDEDKKNYEFNNNGLSRMSRPEGDKLGMFDGGWKIDKTKRKTPSGRFPANVIHDGSEDVLKLFPNTKSSKVVNNKDSYEGKSNTNFLRGVTNQDNQYGDEGSAARFFYCSKASKKERNFGLNVDSINKKINKHPTVKPIELMKYLIKLITPKNGIVLDPFMGSGTTGIACKLEGFNFIGIEKEKEYVDIAEARIKAYTESILKYELSKFTE